MVAKFVIGALFKRSKKHLGQISFPTICFNFLLHIRKPLLRLYLCASFASFSFEGKNNPGVFKYEFQPQEGLLHSK